MIGAATDTIGAVICGVIPGVQAGALVLGISAALKGLPSYLIDKYGKSRSVYISATVKYGIKTQSYNVWVV